MEWVLDRMGQLIAFEDQDVLSLDLSENEVVGLNFLQLFSGLQHLFLGRNHIGMYMWCAWVGNNLQFWVGFPRHRLGYPS
jgi:hypothetical protein